MEIGRQPGRALPGLCFLILQKKAEACEASAFKTGLLLRKKGQSEALSDADHFFDIR